MALWVKIIINLNKLEKSKLYLRNYLNIKIINSLLLRSIRLFSRIFYHYICLKIIIFMGSNKKDELYVLNRKNLILFLSNRIILRKLNHYQCFSSFLEICIILWISPINLNPYFYKSIISKFPLKKHFLFQQLLIQIIQK